MVANSARDRWFVGICFVDSVDKGSSDRFYRNSGTIGQNVGTYLGVPSGIPHVTKFVKVGAVEGSNVLG